MKIIGALWHNPANLTIVLCDCGHRFFHPCNRYRVKCPRCRQTANLEELRQAIKPGQIQAGNKEA